MSKRIHLIGVCGTAMATLACLLRSRGHLVGGSDQNVYPPMSDFLAREGIDALAGYSADHITDEIGLVVVGNAISRGNPELEAVLDRRIRYCSLPEAIRDEFLWQQQAVVVAGTHGKTTTTSLTGWLLTSAGLDPTVLVGGIALNLGDRGSSYRVGSGAHFVIEGDEYDSAFFDKSAKFLKYLPQIAVINNIEFDHADIYADMAAVRLAFRRLVNLVPRQGLLLVGADESETRDIVSGALCAVETFGLSEDATWRATDLTMRDGMTSFEVRRHAEVFGHFESPLLGVHNVRNALAGIAVGARVGLAASALAEGLRTFRGIKRRLEIVGVAGGVTVIDDFAHHPTAVRETLAALRAGYPARRVWAVFEPRSASSCRRVFQQAFAESFVHADEVVVASVFRSSLPEVERLSAEQLVADILRAGQSARYIPDVEEIVAAIVAEHRPGDVVALMSNGGFGGIHQRLVQALGS